jgi:CRISPR-associated protein Cas2
MRYVVVYDISDDRVRARVSDVCEAFGARVQESVFECELGEDGLDELLRRLGAELLDPAEGNARVYRVCKDCLQASVGLGGTAEGIGDAPCIVL